MLSSNIKVGYLFLFKLWYLRTFSLQFEWYLYIYIKKNILQNYRIRNWGTRFVIFHLFYVSCMTMIYFYTNPKKKLQALKTIKNYCFKRQYMWMKGNFTAILHHGETIYHTEMYLIWISVTHQSVWMPQAAAYWKC